MFVVADFFVEYKAEMDEKLHAAVSAACSDASADRTRGVLITRHDFCHFSVALSPEVPFGLIHEQDLARRV